MSLSRGVTAGYAAGSVGTGGFGVLPGLVLAYYLTDTLAVSATIASLVVVVPKIIDILINPAIGAASDREATARGNRVRLMGIGAVAILPLFILTFWTPPGTGSAGGAWWVLAFFSLAAVAYSLFQVPYIALPAELTGDYDERTRLIAVRIAVLALTILAVGAGGPAIRDAFGGGRTGYLVMAVAAGAVISAGMLAATLGAATLGAARFGAPRRHGAETGYRHAFAALRSSRHYRILLAVFILQALASAVMLAGAQYLATYVLDDSGALTILFVALVAPALLVMPLWYRIGRRWGKVRALVAASVLFGAAALGLAGAVWSAGPWIFGLVAVAGVGYAGMQTFPLAMLPDIIDEHSADVGADRGGALSGLWTAGETVGLALGPTVFLLVLGAGGFVSSTADVTPDQPGSAITAIILGFSLVPAALVGASLALLTRYDRPEEGMP